MKEIAFGDKDFIENNFPSAEEYEIFLKEFNPPEKLKRELNKYYLD